MFHNHNKNNFFIFTGGPGAGKSTTLEALKQQGYLVVPEVARTIIKEQRKTGGNATHMGDRIAYRDLMLKHSIADFKTMISVTLPVFFDRGIPDLVSYSKRFCGHITKEIEQAVHQYRYHSTVFIFPPWPEIYCHDTERKQNFSEAIETYNAVKTAYLGCGYNLIEIPKLSIAERAHLIIQHCL